MSATRTLFMGFITTSQRIASGVVLVSAVLILPKAAHASVITIGNGTPASCTESATRDALAQAAAGAPAAANIRFDCGNDPLTIRFAFQDLGEELLIPDKTTVDGGDRITIKGRFLVGPDTSVKIVRLGLTGLGPGFPGIVNHGTLEVRGSVFTDNAGPGIDNSGGLVTVTDTVFSRSRGPSGVKAIQSDGTLHVDRSMFEQNPGGPAILGNGVLDVKNTIFRSNGGDSAAIFHSGHAEIHNCEFTDNGGTIGGAIRHGGGELVIKNSLFMRNVGQWGGAVASDGVLTVEFSEFYDNQVTAAGGAIFHCGSMAVTDTQIKRNSARDNFGGGIWTSKSPMLRNNTIVENRPDDIVANASPPPGVFCAP
jgi:Right handed beta helix region